MALPSELIAQVLAQISAQIGRFHEQPTSDRAASEDHDGDERTQARPAARCGALDGFRSAPGVLTCF